jgi:CelD/BcsL family acetyltransferase involved in cellulose biosynthesis
MITYKSRFLRRAEVWFDNQPPVAAQSVDWILYHQRTRPVPGAKSRSFYTLLVDLSQSPEQLLSQLSEDTAYKIRRARERDKIFCECCDPRDRAVMNRFEQVHKAFAAMKGLPRLNRTRLENLATAGLLDISVARDAQGNVLVFHANYRDPLRATQLELPSLYRALPNSHARNFVGRANRYLTWSDILRYKELGLKFFDFGGWHLGNDHELLNINDFKRGFGGTVVREYQCEQILTLKGRLVLSAAKLLGRAKSVLSPRDEPALAPERDFSVEPSVAIK